LFVRGRTRRAGAEKGKACTREREREQARVGKVLLPRTGTRTSEVDARARCGVVARTVAAARGLGASPGTAVQSLVSFSCRSSLLSRKTSRRKRWSWRRRRRRRRWRRQRLRRGPTCARRADGGRRNRARPVRFVLRSFHRFARVSPEYLRRDAPVFKNRRTNNRSDKINIINNVLNRPSAALQLHAGKTPLGSCSFFDSGPPLASFREDHPTPRAPSNGARPDSAKNDEVGANPVRDGPVLARRSEPADQEKASSSTSAPA
jgi:hypothetical protein